jgi:hypothetical protein
LAYRRRAFEAAELGQLCANGRSEQDEDSECRRGPDSHGAIVSADTDGRNDSLQPRAAATSITERAVMAGNRAFTSADDVAALRSPWVEPMLRGALTALIVSAIGKRMVTGVKHANGMMETIFDKPFSIGNETHYFAEYEPEPGETLQTSCAFHNDTDMGVPFGESSDTEMCYQFTFHWPAHSLSNRAASLLGVPDTCW